MTKPSRTKRLIASLGIAIVFACSAAASAQGGGSVSRLAPPPELDMAAVCENVEHEEAQRYPERAYRRRDEGIVMLDCALSEGGTFTACRAIVESPANRGFGEAAMKMACFVRIPRDAVTGAFEPNARRGVEIYANESGQARSRVTFEFRID